MCAFDGVIFFSFNFLSFIVFLIGISKQITSDMAYGILF